MPRATRILGDDITYHVVAKCNAKEHFLKSHGALEDISQHLEKCQRNFHFEIHAYCLMHSHIHLILTTRKNIFLDKVMYEICQRFSFQYNRQHNREGHFWKRHYFSKVILNDVQGLVSLRYLHLNPVRAGIVQHPEQWPWSCAQTYLNGAENIPIHFLPSYQGLADEDVTRQQFYKKWIQTTLINLKTEQTLLESKLRPGSRRFQYILKKEIKPLLANLTRK